MSAEFEALLAVVNKRLDDLTEDVTAARCVWVAALASVVVMLGAKKLITEDDVPRLMHVAELIAEQIEEAIEDGLGPEDWFDGWVREPWEPKPRRPKSKRSTRRKRDT